MTVALTQNPVRALTTRLGELKEEADRRIADLESTLRHIDETRELLNEHGIGLVVDLGPMGNAFQNARRALVDDNASETYVAPVHRIA